MDGTLLKGLGILGWAHLEPVVVAALLTEAPLLLVGPHGTAKSLLLTRLADALGLSLRHYNASTLNFDDLVGFPVPDGDTVRYLRTPLDAWEAEAVFIDELSRCRADLQNRLFPLIHERRLQGRSLERLRFRWSAMNPPPAVDQDPDDALYAGAIALDAALADRFPWVIEVPHELVEADRLALLTDCTPTEGGAVALAEALDQARARRGLIVQVHGDAVARYVSAAGHVLGRAGTPVSLRRLRMIRDNVLAVLAVQPWERPADAALLALRWSLPDRARGDFDGRKVLEAHVAAREELMAPSDPLRMALLAERDPVRRVVLSLTGDDDLLTATVLDARAGLPEAQRLALSARLFPLLAKERPALPGILFEGLADDAGRLAALTSSQESVQTRSPRRELANRIGRVVAGLAAEQRWLEDVLWLCYREEIPITPESLAEFGRHLDDVLAHRDRSGAAA